MRPIATHDPVVWCVSQSVARLHCTKTAERIEVLFGVETLYRMGSLDTLRREGSMRPLPNYFDLLFRCAE